MGVAPVLSDGVIGRRGYKGDKFFHEDFFWDVEGTKLAHTKKSFASGKKKRREQTRITRARVLDVAGPASSSAKGRRGGGGGGKELAGCVLIFNAKRHVICITDDAPLCLSRSRLYGSKRRRQIGEKRDGRERG